ncbi:hypothetical protein S2091_0480 [Solimicrobium silvestre]|uniref:Uncharacterized protein n=1 Tax=Solimicrobium silvestre TaxID=2099400 RepID=A0A2S9H5M2_9BURK|nr:hypothetical protein S2091_0480 [Solimicrobium silvestre]
MKLTNYQINLFDYLYTVENMIFTHRKTIGYAKNIKI